MRADVDLLELDLYELLGVEVGAKNGEIRAAYRRRARESHPDLNPLDPASGARMSRLNRAARILLDPARRAAYDRARGATGASGSRAGGVWYDRIAGDSEWTTPDCTERPLTAAGRRYRRRVRSSGDALALQAREWLLGLQRGEQLLLAAVCFALGSGLLMWAHPVNAFWTSPPSADDAPAIRAE